MDVHREATWLQASDLVVDAGEPSPRKTGFVGLAVLGQMSMQSTFPMTRRFVVA